MASPSQSSRGPATLDSLGTKSTTTTIDTKTTDFSGRNRSTFTFTGTSLTVTDALTYLGTKFFDFPEGMIRFHGAYGSLQFTTTSTLSSTLNASKAILWSVGTATAAGVMPTTAECNIIPPVVAVSSATISVANTATVGLSVPSTAARYTVNVHLATLATIADAEVIYIRIPHNFTLTGTPKVMAGFTPVTTAAKAATITTGIRTTSLASPVTTSCTGGVFTLTSANMTPAGAIVDGTAFSAVNNGLAGDSIALTASSVTAFSEGDAWIQIEVINNDLCGGGSALVNGTSTAADAYLNFYVPLATDIDGDATVEVNGTIIIDWTNEGDL